MCRTTAQFKYWVLKLSTLNAFSVIVLALGLLLVGGVLIGTFDHKYDYSRQLIQTFEEKPMTVSDIKNLKGNIISIQYDSYGTPAWILTGRWKLVDSSTNESAPALTFGANITMVGINGTGEHRHRLLDFRMQKMTFNNMTVLIQGTSTLTTSGIDPVSLGDISKVPITIRIENLRTIIIEIDRHQIKDHFGKFPIYGTIAGIS